MFALDVVRKLILHRSVSADDMHSNVRRISARHVPPPRIRGVDGTAFEVGVHSPVFARCVLDTPQLEPVAPGKAGLRDVASAAGVQVAEVKVKVAVVVGINLDRKVNNGALFICSDDGHRSIGHKRTANHVGIVALGVATKAGAGGRTRKIAERLIRSPACWREVLSCLLDGAAVEAVGAVVSDWICGN